jgi:thioredoxin 1
VATLTLTEENFESVVEGNDIVFIDFWAEWCGPCRTFGPIYEKVSEQFPDITFAKIDTEDQQAIAASFNIQSIPTLMIIREQVIIYSQAGAMPEDALSDIVSQVQALDMKAIHEEIAAKNAQA